MNEETLLQEEDDVDGWWELIGDGYEYLEIRGMIGHVAMEKAEMLVNDSVMFHKISERQFEIIYGKNYEISH